MRDRARNISPMLASPRCGAKTRCGDACRSPAVRGKRRCRMHGGAVGSGAPTANQNARKHGLFASDAIAELDEVLHTRGIEFCFAELKDPVKDKLKRFGLFSQLGESCFFPTIGAAVASYLKANDVEWEDWEDQAKR